LWKVLTKIATEAASSAGDRDRPQLLEELQKSSFRLAPASSNAGALRILADLSRSALEDIDDAVSGVSLPRTDYASAVHTALDEHRYVDIRGDAGVGKSGILRHFAEQLNEESPVLVLTPERTPGGGCLELRSKLGFDGNCHELLCDLARNGAAIVLGYGNDSGQNGPFGERNSHSSSSAPSRGVCFNGLWILRYHSILFF
jgi:hypothetical protein